jgi:hypothetical protein
MLVISLLSEVIGMADLLIRNVDAKTMKGIEARAKRKGLAREEYLRRELAILGDNEARPALTRADLERSLAAMADLTDETVMENAWS